MNDNHVASRARAKRPKAKKRVTLVDLLASSGVYAPQTDQTDPVGEGESYAEEEEARAIYDGWRT